MKLCSCLSECSLKCHVRNQQYAVQEIWITKCKWCYFHKDWCKEKINCLLLYSLLWLLFFPLITDGNNCRCPQNKPGVKLVFLSDSVIWESLYRGPYTQIWLSSMKMWTIDKLYAGDADWGNSWLVSLLSWERREGKGRLNLHESSQGTDFLRNLRICMISPDLKSLAGRLGHRCSAKAFCSQVHNFSCFENLKKSWINLEVGLNVCLSDMIFAFWSYLDSLKEAIKYLSYFRYKTE